MPATLAPRFVGTSHDCESIPADAAMIMSALEAGGHRKDTRVEQRSRYRVTATLRLFSDQQPTPPWLLYTRDISPRSLGFVSPHRLPLGYGGILELPGPSGEPMQIHCTLLRCREAAPGWFEGSVYFNRIQTAFEAE